MTDEEMAQILDDLREEEARWFASCTQSPSASIGADEDEGGAV